MSAPVRLLFPCLLWALAQAALAGQVYRWVDAQGGVHYSATPPPGGQQTESMTVRSPGGSPQPAEPQVEAPTPQQLQEQAQKKAADNARAHQEQAEAERLAQCAKARSNVERLETRASRKFLREDGTYQRYSNEERDRIVAHERAFLQEHCD